ncbi:hypothetical protein V8F33_003100 [Rhypophila sp. PSN 637]
MRIATPTFRCRVRSSSFAPSKFHLGFRKSLESGIYRVYRPSFSYPYVQLSRQSGLSTAWFKSEPTSRPDSDAGKDAYEIPSTTTKLSPWSLFGWTKASDDQAGLYGKWDWLSEDEERLSYESDVLGEEEPGSARLVDWPTYDNDINLWLCILDFRAREDGREGISEVLQGLMRRHCLSSVQGAAAERFWGTILDAALEDENDRDMLQDVWAYAECMYEDCGVQWPNLYVTVISSFIERQCARKAMWWERRLRPYFGLSSDGTLELIKRYIFDSDYVVQYFLRRLCTECIDDDVYDQLIPHLYDQGCLLIANRWQHLLRARNDGPRSNASRPYLRLRAAYYPRSSMTESELRAAGLEQQPRGALITVNRSGNGFFQFSDVRLGIPRPLTKEMNSIGLRYLINRAHGETYGIEEKLYDDSIGARWFATSWVSVDSTIATVQTLGFNSIGPLSLQSIALREKTADQITRRIEQLASSGISITESTYTRALRSFAAAGDQILLDRLLQSDIHPDVFDDISTQRKILESDARTGNWSQYELIVAVKLAVSTSVVSAVSDTLLQICLRMDKRMRALHLVDLHTTYAREPHCTEHTVEMIGRHILAHVSSHTWRHRPQLGRNHFYSALLQKLIPGKFPLQVEATRRILFRLGRDNLFDELARVSEMLALRHHTIFNSQHHLTYFHKADLPTILHADSSNNDSSYVAVPHDLDYRRPLHPVRQIFDIQFQRNIVRWGFRLSRYHNIRMDAPHVVDLMEPKHFHFARGIRVLAMLRDYGVVIYERAVAKSVELRIAELFWSGRLHELYAPLMRERGILHAADRTAFVLNEALCTCEEAWQIVSSVAGEGKTKWKGHGEPESLRPLLDMKRAMERIQYWGKQWQRKRREVFVSFLPGEPARRGGPLGRDPTRYRSRPGHVTVLGRFPVRKYGHQNL